MLRLLLNQDFDHDIIREILRRMPDLDYTTAFALGLSQADDRRLLLQAVVEKRIILTHDETTMPGHYFALINKGEVARRRFYCTSQTLDQVGAG